MLTKKRLLAVGVTIVIVVAGVAARQWYNWPVHHFGVVEPGVLYRSAQPDRSGWERLRDYYGIRSVLDLREEAPDEPWAVLEREFCAENGIRHVRLPVQPPGLTDEELRIVVETIADPDCRPVLVHCELGKARTGVVVAAYRIAVQGWSYEAAMAEARRYKKDFGKRGYADYLEGLADGQGSRPAVAKAIGSGADTGYATCCGESDASIAGRR